MEGVQLDGETESLADCLDRASNVLLSAPPVSPAECDVCAEVMDVAPPRDMNVLAITYRRSPDEWLSDFRDHFDDDPATLQIVAVDETSRGVAAPAGESGLQGARSVASVESPHDLTGLGIQVTDFLQHVEGPDGPGGATETVVCFDSLTALLQFVDLQEAFRFLHALTSQIASVGAAGHFHVHPTAIDGLTSRTVGALFDGSVRVGEDAIEEVDVD